MARGTRFRKGIKSTTNGGQVGGSIAYSGSSITITHGWDNLTGLSVSVLTSGNSIGIVRIADNSINGAVSAAIYANVAAASLAGSTVALSTDTSTIYWLATGYQN